MKKDKIISNFKCPKESSRCRLSFKKGPLYPSKIVVIETLVKGVFTAKTTRLLGGF